MARLLAHEWLFGGFMFVMAMRLVAHQGLAGADALAFLGGLGIATALTVWNVRVGSTASWRWRLAFYAVAMNVYFQQMRTAVPAVQPAKFDLALRNIDRWLLPDTPALLLESWSHPLITEVLSLCYMLFMPYLAFSILSRLFGDLARLKSFCAGLFSLYGIGFLGYSLVPAGGPYLAFPEMFSTHLSGGLFADWNASMVRFGSSGVDVFPSLHVAVSAFLLGFDRRHQPWRYRAYLVPALGMWAATLYLRYHYLIDVLSGLCLAALALWIAHRQTIQGECP
jgi:hypothetical protein